MPVRSELAVPGPPWARAATDLVALAGVASLAAAFWFDWIVVALFALVLLGITVPRVLRLPGALQALSGAVFLLAAWAAVLDWYVLVPHLDLVTHALANGLLAVYALALMTRAGLLPARLPRVGTVVLTTALGALLAVVWETGEWAGHTYFDDAIGVGYDDTIGDLAWGTLGSALGGLCAAAAGTGVSTSHPVGARSGGRSGDG